MSRHRSLEQERAAFAWASIEEVISRNQQLSDERRYWKDYGSLARSAAAYVQANGLGQALAFWRAKGYEWNPSERRSKPKQDDAHAELLGHVANWLHKQKIVPDDKDLVEWISKDATTEEYRQASAEAIAFLIWLKRFAEAELPKEGD